MCTSESVCDTLYCNVLLQRFEGEKLENIICGFLLFDESSVHLHLLPYSGFFCGGNISRLGSLRIFEGKKFTNLSHILDLYVLVLIV